MHVSMYVWCIHRGWDVPRGAEGPGGNFSNSLRLNLRSNCVALERIQLHLARLGLPPELLARFSPCALATTPNENFNGRQRRHRAMSTVLQWLIDRTELILEETKYIQGVGFSYWTGGRRTRQHYLEANLVAAPSIFRVKKQKVDGPPLSTDELAECREFAHQEFGGSKTQRVTDKAKEVVGALPAIFYGPAPVQPIPNAAATALLASLLETSGGRAGGMSSSGEVSSRVILFPRSLFPRLHQASRCPWRGLDRRADGCTGCCG